MPDYLSCGACHAEFEVVDFYRFIDHKQFNCGHGSHSHHQLGRAESVLECSKCLKKCRTPWSLLQHLELEHCLSLARTLLLPSASTVPDVGSSAHPTDQQAIIDTSEACTQTTRSCLKRQVCPYEEGLPDECCLKASKEQLASDSGCCCMDSYGVGGRSGGCGGSGGGSGGGGGDGSGGGERQTDCCLAVPKKRRLLPAAAATNGDSVAGAASSASEATASSAAPLSGIEGVGNDECCGQQPNCGLRRSVKRQMRSAECQTDFVLNLLDLDVEMLLEDAAAASVDVPPPTASLVVGGDGVSTAAAASAAATAASLHNSTSPTEAASSASRRPLPPAPSKAIQTVISQMAAEPVIVCAEQPPPPTVTSAGATFFYAPAAAALPATMQFPQLQQQQHEDSATVSLLLPAASAQQQTLPALSLAPVSLPNLEPVARLATAAAGSATSTTAAGAAAGASRVFVAPRSAVGGVTEPKYRCGQCSRSFRQNIHLRKHVMSQHSHSKPHKCPSCDYTTVEKSHLTVHIRKHTGERPFVCRVCDYSTAQNCTLKAHYLRKHPGSVVHCGRCGQEFVTEHERDKHEKSCCHELLELAAVV